MKKKVNFLSEELRPKTNQSAGWTSILFAILITATISGSGVYFFQKNNIELAKSALKERDGMRQEILVLKKTISEGEQKTNSTTGPTLPIAATTTPTTTEVIIPTETGSVVYNYKYVGLDKTSKYWEPVFASTSGTQKIVLSRKATDALNKNKETVSNFFAPTEPSNTDVIYVSSFISTSTKQFINYIYSYDVKSGELKKVFQKQANLILKTLGITEKGIVFAAVKTNDSLGQCYSIWAGHDDSLYYYLDTSVSKPELKSFTLPKDRIDQGRQEEADCLSK